MRVAVVAGFFCASPDSCVERGTSTGPVTLCCGNRRGYRNEAGCPVCLGNRKKATQRKLAPGAHPYHVQ